MAKDPSGVPKDQGKQASGARVVLDSDPPGSRELPRVARALRFFLFSVFQGRECPVPNRQICLVPASARGTLAWKVLPAH